MVKIIQDQEEKILNFFQKSGGIARTRDILSQGIYPRTLYLLRKQGIIEVLAPGLNRWVDMPLPSHYELVVVSILVPKAVICLISALDFHGITTQIPHAICVALPKGTKAPRLSYPKLRVFTYSQKDYESGVKTHDLDGFTIKVYSPEKTVVDCFKFRNKIGLDVAIEGLRLCFERKGSKPMKFLQFARIARVKNIITPYIQAICA